LTNYNLEENSKILHSSIGHAAGLSHGLQTSVICMYCGVVLSLKYLMCTPQSNILRERWCTQKSRLETPDHKF